MLYKINIPFSSEKNISYRYSASSVMHGALMEIITPGYADVLHSMSLRPFSQYVKSNIWTISTLTKEAFENIILPVTETEHIYISQKDDTLTLGKPDVSSISYDDLFKKHYIDNTPSRNVRFAFNTPSAFKSGGTYCNMPSSLLIFKSLAKRYDFTCNIHDTIYDTLFEEMEKSLCISRYELRSASFSLENVRIPSFTGTASIRINSNNVFRSYINMLSEYAEYSGVGIKTALGMGNVSVQFIDNPQGGLNEKQ